MARITLGSVINSISGSIDQLVYSTWKGINYIRSKAKTINNPQSSNQGAIRARLAECAKYWYDTLTQEERNAWETYASSIVIPSSGPGDIIKPPKGPFSGYTAFIRNNMNAFTASISPAGTFISAAPIGETPPDAPVSFSVTAVTPPNTLRFNWVEGTIKGLNCRLWLRSTGAGIHAQMNGNPLATALTYDITDCYAAQGLNLLLSQLKGVFDVQMDIVDEFGQPSPPSVLRRNLIFS